MSKTARFGCLNCHAGLRLKSMGIRMWRFLMIISFLLLSACTHYNEQQGYVILGDQKSNRVWVYLCGLTRQWDSSEERSNRKILEQIANKEHIKVVAIKSFARCSQFDDKLCWPHDTQEQVKNTYANINHVISGYDIDGFIGFSNGAFFLNRAAQEIALNKPIISIGGAGYFDSEKDIDTRIYLIIGKQDHSHYENAILFHKRANKYKHDSVQLMTHDSGHVMPEDIIRQVIHDLNQQAGVSYESK
ncbi:MAG: hypothetical protein ACPG7U_03650 [Holosporaceae bacterium]